MLAALAGQDALAADETPVNVLGKNAPRPAAREEGEEQDPEDKEKAADGQGELFPAWRYHAVLTDSPFELVISSLN